MNKCGNHIVVWIMMKEGALLAHRVTWAGITSDPGPSNRFWHRGWLRSSSGKAEPPPMEGPMRRPRPVRGRR